jgi:hypothetical protein
MIWADFVFGPGHVARRGLVRLTTPGDIAAAMPR